MSDRSAEGYPDFGPEKADLDPRQVNERVAELIAPTIARWDAAVPFRQAGGSAHRLHAVTFLQHAVALWLEEATDPGR